MSADNWAICPSCIKIQEAKKEKLLAEAKKAYGKVPPDEYLLMVGQANKKAAPKETLREVYELGIDEDGVFVIYYRASCDKCGFRFDYNDQTEAVNQAKSNAKRGELDD